MNDAVPHTDGWSVFGFFLGIIVPGDGSTLGPKRRAKR